MGGDPVVFLIVLAFVMVTLLFFWGTFFRPLYRPRSGIVARIFSCMYCCTAVVGSWVVGCFFSAVCCAVLRTAVVQGGWVGGSVRGGVMGSWGFFFSIFPPRYTGPALAYSGVQVI